MKIKLKKKKIVLTCSGIIIGSILLTNINSPINSQNIKYVPNFKNSTTYVIESNKNLESNEKSENITSEVNEEKLEYNHSEKDNNGITNNTTYNKNTNKTSSNVSQNNIQYNNSNQNTNNTFLNTTSTPSTNITTHTDESTITIHRNNGSTITINLEEYVIGVVAAEMPASFNLETLKAQSVLARTYALKAQKTGKILTDTVSTQCYIDTNQMQSKWGSSYNTYYNKIKSAVNATTGEYLTYNGNYIEALYHSTNNGKTESSVDVFGNYYPYLISVTSEYDKSASSYLRNVTMDLNTLSSKLGINLTSDSIIEILSYTDGGNIKEINIAGSTFTCK